MKRDMRFNAKAVSAVLKAARAFGSYDRVIVCDFETYYDREYSLKNMAACEYVVDPLFEVILCAALEFREGDTTPVAHTMVEREVRRKFVEWNDGRTLFVAHNAMFDATVARKFVPAVLPWACTMQMAHQQLFPATGSVSLQALARHFGFDVEKETLVKMQGRRRCSLSHSELHKLIEYAHQDVWACSELFQRMEIMGEGEPELLMWTIARAVYPSLAVDLDLLDETVRSEQTRLQDAMAQLGLVPSQLRSAQQFAALLEARGVSVPTKPGAAGAIPAVAKTDPFMEELLEHPEPEIAQLAELRLLATSSITRTRAARMLAVGRALGGEMIVPLNWHKARTGRWTGAERLNLQNLSRGHGPLRRAIMAPPGRTLVVVDAAQIEARIVAALANARSLSEAFSQGRDVYSEFASILYGHPVTKASHPQKRQVGKLAVLSLGYGCGAAKFRDIARVSGGVHLSDEEAERIVATYRETWPEIPALWRFFDRILKLMVWHSEFPIHLPNYEMPPLVWNAPNLILPSGRPIVFASLRYDTEKEQFMVQHNQHGRVYERSIWGGHVTENVVQAMARDVLCRVHLKHVDKVVLQVHDELVLVATPDEANDLLQECIRDLSSTVEWLPTCGLAAEGAVAVRYGDAK